VLTDDEWLAEMGTPRAETAIQSELLFRAAKKK
jgi:hypothetical protein